MAIAGLRINLQLRSTLRKFFQECRASTLTASHEPEKSTFNPPQESKNPQNDSERETPESKPDNKFSSKVHLPYNQDKYRFIYPEFLPDPNPFMRNSVREKIERADMLARRSNVQIPEFYVGSVLAVTYSDKHAPGKTSRFLGICIGRKGTGLRASFVLRNVVDGLGVEINFELYDPTVQQIECIKLEKRLDDELFYLRDAPLEYSYFPQDMEPEYLPEGTEVPLNPLKVPLKPPPRETRWELHHNLRGIIDRTEGITEKRKRRAMHPQNWKPWEEFDLIKMYRATIPVEEQREIYSEVYAELHKHEIQRQRAKRTRTFVRPKKIG